MSKIIKSKRSFGFVQIPNDLIQRPDMSAQAKGLICYLLSLPDDWVIYKKEIANHFTNGRTSLDAAFEELENLGYLVGADQVKNNGKFAGRDYILYDKPFGNTDVENQHSGITDAQNQHRPMHEINNGTDAQNQHLQIHSINKYTNINKQLYSDDFEFFFTNYHNITKQPKTDKEASYREWKKLTKQEQMKANEKVNQYYNSLCDKKYVKKARTYLKDKNFNDEFKSIQKPDTFTIKPGFNAF
jgi:hypothetical protein